MDRNTKGQKAQQKTIATYSARPDLAQDTSSGTASIGEGLTCTYRQGDDELVMDMGEALGGDGTAPTPGLFARASIAGCVAIGIKMTAMRDGVTLKGVHVDLEQDFDSRGLMGFNDIPATPLDTRLNIRIDSDEPLEKIEATINRALTCDPWFLSFRDAQNVSTRIEVSVSA